MNKSDGDGSWSTVEHTVEHTEAQQQEAQRLHCIHHQPGDECHGGKDAGDALSVQ